MLKINNKIKFENNLWLGIVDSSEFNSSDEARIRAVTDIASITKGRLGFKEIATPLSQRGKDNNIIPSNRDRRLNFYNKLLTESAGKPSTPFEFIPINYPNQFKYSSEINIFGNWKYGIPYKTAWLTNLRDVIIKITHASVKYNTSDEIKDFKIIVGRVPFKVIEYLNGKSTFNFIYELQNESEEVCEKYLNNVEFWYPSWWVKKLKDLAIKEDSRLVKNLKQLVLYEKTFKPEEATMELSDRRLVTFAMCAWKTDKTSWDNLFVVKDEKTGTQSITKIVVDNIKTLINK